VRKVKQLTGVLKGTMRTLFYVEHVGTLHLDRETCIGCRNILKGLPWQSPWNLSERKEIA